MFPSAILRTSMVLSQKNGKAVVSTAFNAYFGNGVCKVRTIVRKVPVSLLNASEMADTHMDKDCPLFYRDWSAAPTMERINA